MVRASRPRSSLPIFWASTLLSSTQPVSLPAAPATGAASSSDKANSGAQLPRQQESSFMVDSLPVATRQGESWISRSTVLYPERMMNEATWRLAVFATALLACMVAERLWCRDPVPKRRGAVIGANLAMGFVSALLLRFGLPWLAMDAAVWARESATGLLHLLSLPAPLEFLIGLLLLELAVYLQHRASHRVPLLWRLHAVHHSEAHLDASSSLRFHPLEALLSMLWKMGVVVAFGIDPWAVLVFEITLNAMAAFNHANLRLAPRLNRLLGSIVVTPDLHRLHHVIGPAGTAVNYGFNLLLWDRLFGSLQRPPTTARGAAAALGAAPGAPLSAAGLGRLLWMPFSIKNMLNQRIEQ